MPYVQWIREGHLEATPGDVIDYDVIRERIRELGDRYRIQEIAIDRWNATQLATQLSGDGFEVAGRRGVIEFYDQYGKNYRLAC